MTTATLEATALPLADLDSPRTLVRSGGDGLTLGQALAGVWEGLSSTGAAECPVCHGRLVAAGGHGATCCDCGSSLA